MVGAPAFQLWHGRDADLRRAGTALESEGLASLIVACIAQAVRDVDEGVPWEDPAPRMIEENMWRAIRFGRTAADRPARRRSTRRPPSSGSGTGRHRYVRSTVSTSCFPTATALSASAG